MERSYAAAAARSRVDGTDGRTDVRRARVLSLFQADVPPSRAAPSGPTWLSWGSSDPHALTYSAPRSLARPPLLAPGPCRTLPLSFPSADKAEPNEQRRTCSKFFPTGLPGERPEGGDDGGGGRAAEIGLRTPRRWQGSYYTRRQPGNRHCGFKCLGFKKALATTLQGTQGAYLWQYKNV